MEHAIIDSLADTRLVARATARVMTRYMRKAPTGTSPVEASVIVAHAFAALLKPESEPVVERKHRPYTRRAAPKTKAPLEPNAIPVVQVVTDDTVYVRTDNNQGSWRKLV